MVRLSAAEKTSFLLSATCNSITKALDCCNISK
jgi:hypothetical protein